MKRLYLLVCLCCIVIATNAQTTLTGWLNFKMNQIPLKASAQKTEALNGEMSYVSNGRKWYIKTHFPPKRYWVQPLEKHSTVSINFYEPNLSWFRIYTVGSQKVENRVFETSIPEYKKCIAILDASKEQSTTIIKQKAEDCYKNSLRCYHFWSGFFSGTKGNIQLFNETKNFSIKDEKGVTRNYLCKKAEITDDNGLKSIVYYTTLLPRQASLDKGWSKLPGAYLYREYQSEGWKYTFTAIYYKGSIVPDSEFTAPKNCIETTEEDYNNLSRN